MTLKFRWHPSYGVPTLLDKSNQYKRQLRALPTHRPHPRDSPAAITLPLFMVCKCFLSLSLPLPERERERERMLMQTKVLTEKSQEEVGPPFLTDSGGMHPLWVTS